MAAASGSGLAAVKALKEHGAVKALKEHGAEEGSGHLVAELRPNPPMQLKNFHVMTTLGTGTFGRVRIVKNLSDNSTHALKIMKKEAIIRLNQLDHVLSEVDLMMRLEHPFIVNMVGMFQDALTVYLVLEYVPGGEVFTILREEGRFTSAQSIFYGAEICLAFEYLHKYSIAYRDLKPENLLISKGGHIKITDFGFAKLIPPGEKHGRCAEHQSTWRLKLFKVRDTEQKLIGGHLVSCCTSSKQVTHHLMMTTRLEYIKRY